MNFYAVKSEEKKATEYLQVQLDLRGLFCIKYWLRSASVLSRNSNPHLLWFLDFFFFALVANGDIDPRFSPPGYCAKLSGCADCKHTRLWVRLETSSFSVISSLSSPGLLFPRQQCALHTLSLRYRNRPDNIVSEE